MNVKTQLHQTLSSQHFPKAISKVNRVYGKFITAKCTSPDKSQLKWNDRIVFYEGCTPDWKSAYCLAGKCTKSTKGNHQECGAPAPEASFGFVDSTNVVATASMSAKVTASVYISDQSPFTGTFLRLTCDGVKVSYRLARRPVGRNQEVYSWPASNLDW